MSKSKFTATSIFLTLVAGLFLLTPANVNAQKPQKINSLMWKAASGKQTVYLLGSIHLATKDFYPLPPEIETAFDQSSVLLVEIDLNKLDAAAAQTLIQKNGIYAGDDSLWKHISPATAAQVKKFCAEYGVPVEAFARLKPWVVAITAGVLPLQKQGMDASFGIDKYFLDKAKDKKRVQSIESAEWQLELFSALSDSQQEQYLKSTLEQTGQIKEFAGLLQNVWLNGDSKQLETLVSEMATQPAELQKKLLDDRNPGMANAAEQCLKGTEQCFIVVGAAHLVGNKGVVQLLKDRGYAVEQVAVTPRKN